MTKVRKGLLAGLLLSIFTVGGVLISGAVLAYSHRDTFYPGIRIADLELAGKTREQATDLLKQKIDLYAKHPVKIIVPDVSKPLKNSPNQYEEASISVDSGELGLTFKSEDVINQAWAIGHQNSLLVWVKTVSESFFLEKQFTLPYTVDSVAITTFINTQVIPKIGMPIPARVVVIGERVSIDSPRPGFEIDKERLKKQVAASFESVTDSDTTYLKAPVTQVYSSVSNESIQPLADQLDALGNTKITLEAKGVKVSPTRTEILQWFSPVQDEGGVVSLVVQKEKIATYLSSQKSVDSTKSVDSVVEKLSSLIGANTLQLSIAVIPKATKLSSDAFTAGKFEGKYVEVNLSAQKLYLIQGTNLEKSYVISSGKWATPTPKGVFAIQGKIARAYSASFGLYMPYWQNFLNGEYGLHELPEWPNGYKEGQSHLGTPVSHGCVRLGIGDAKEVYDWTEIGTPVYIH